MFASLFGGGGGEVLAREVITISSKKMMQPEVSSNLPDIVRLIHPETGLELLLGLPENLNTPSGLKHVLIL